MPPAKANATGLTPPTQPLRNPGLVAFLAGLSICAFLLTWGNSIVDGTVARMLGVLGAGPPLIPGIKEPLRLTYTGIPPIDYWLQIMVVFFWQAVDGSHPTTSLTGIYFLGQLIAIWSLLFVEGNRTVNKGLSVARSLMWALLMQNLTLACFGPIYFAIHLESSSHALPKSTESYSDDKQHASTIQAAQRYLKFLPLSIFLGYVVPSIMIGLPAPTVVPYSTQQAAIAIWTPFPVWVALAQFIFTTLDKRMALEPRSQSIAETKRSLQKTQDLYIQSLKSVYMYALVGSALVHVAVVAISLSTVLFPTIFAPGYPSAFALTKLLRPRISYEALTIGQGVQSFMQWDQWIGYTAVLTWVLVLQQADLVRPEWSTRIWLAVRLLATTVTLGPGAAAIWSVWERDEARWLSSRRSAMQ